MTERKFLSVAVIAGAMLATPALARNSRVRLQHLAEDANASTKSGTRYVGAGDGFRGLAAPSAVLSVTGTGTAMCGATGAPTMGP